MLTIADAPRRLLAISFALCVTAGGSSSSGTASGGAGDGGSGGAGDTGGRSGGTGGATGGSVGTGGSVTLPDASAGGSTESDAGEPADSGSGGNMDRPPMTSGPGKIVLVAGGGNGGDGTPAAMASTNKPFGTVVDSLSGEVYLAQRGGHKCTRNH